MAFGHPGGSQILVTLLIMILCWNIWWTFKVPEGIFWDGTFLTSLSLLICYFDLYANFHLSSMNISVPRTTYP